MSASAAADIELQVAIYHALTTSHDVMALVHDVYDDTRIGANQKADAAPWGLQGGYISFGPESTIVEDYGCFRSSEISVQIDVWSRAIGRVHCKSICAAVIQALDNVTFDLVSHGHLTTGLTLFQIMPDPQEGVTHGVLQFETIIETGG